jgi:hypothetical protein
LLPSENSIAVNNNNNNNTYTLTFIISINSTFHLAKSFSSKQNVIRFFLSLLKQKYKITNQRTYPTVYSIFNTLSASERQRINGFNANGVEVFSCVAANNPAI